MISKPTHAVLGLVLCFLLGSHVTSAQSTSSDISLTGNLSSRVIREDELLQFTLNIKNKSDAKAAYGSVRHLRLITIPDGYSLEQNQNVCVLPLLSPRKDSCQPSKQFLDSGSVIADLLAPGESLTIQGYFKSSSVHKTATLTAVATWASNDGGRPPVEIFSAQSVVLGENQVQSSYWIRRLSFDEWTKILGIPVLLVLIGAITTLTVNWAQKRADTLRHDFEQQRAVRAETWKQMLLVSHSYLKFYLQLSLAYERFSDNLKQSNKDLAFFYLLFAGKKMISTRHEIGGLYFKDLRGERLATECLKQQRLACLGKEDTPLFKAVRASIDRLTEIDDIDAYDTFVRIYANDSCGARSFHHDDMQKAWILFQEWVVKKDEVTKTIQHLEGFCAVLDFECNRPYEYWYETPSRLKITHDVEKILREILRRERYSDKQIDEYFSAVVR